MRKQILNRKQLVLALFIGGAVLVLAGIVVLAVLAPHGASRFYKVMLALIAVVMILLGGFMLASAYHRREEETHFFRFNSETGRNISVSELDFDRINNRLAARMRTVLESDQIMPAVWERNIIREENESEMGGVLAPLIAFKMLYDLARYDRDDYWALFLDADEQLIEDIAAELDRAADGRMAQALLDIYADGVADMNITYIQDFLTGNLRYLRRRMVEYAKEHDKDFY